MTFESIKHRKKEKDVKLKNKVFIFFECYFQFIFIFSKKYLENILFYPKKKKQHIANPEI